MKSPCLALTTLAAVLLAGFGAGAFAQQIPQQVQQQVPKETPKQQTQEQKTLPNTVSKPPEGIGAAVDPNKYVLGPEDVIFIRTWREPDFTFTIGIRPDGKITVPLAGEVQAADLTPLQLTTSLKEDLGKFLNNPDVSVTVIDVRSKKYYMDGEFIRSGAYALVTPTTVLEAISIAGGFREFADQKHVRILRGQKSYTFNYKEVIKGKHLEQNIFVEKGDHVIAR